MFENVNNFSKCRLSCTQAKFQIFHLGILDRREMTDYKWKKVSVTFPFENSHMIWSFLNYVTGQSANPSSNLAGKAWKTNYIRSIVWEFFEDNLQIETRYLHYSCLILLQAHVLIAYTLYGNKKVKIKSFLIKNWPITNSKWVEIAMDKKGKKM